jgi:hypothetical protein
MNLQELLEGGVITRATFDWLEPKWRKEQEDLAAESERNVDNGTPHGWSLFGGRESAGRGGRGGQNDDEDDDDDGGTGSFTQISIGDDEGDGGGGDGPVTLDFFIDDFSAGHGNRVWHASVAMCLYLQNAPLMESWPSSSNNNKSSYGGDRVESSSFRCLELGAGTALPSLYLANLLVARSRMVSSSSPTSPTEGSSASNAGGKKPFIHVTDARQYRNIRQILFSVDRQRLVKDADAVQFRVSPHNWGEGVGREEDSRGADGARVGGGCRNDDDGGGGSTSFLDQECGTTLSSSSEHWKEDSGKEASMMMGNSYDMILVSDCIYNPTHHEALLQSIRALLKLPPPQMEDGNLHTNSNHNGDNAGQGGGGGRAIVSFSLHGNTTDQSVWDFVEHKVGAIRCGEYRLQARAVPHLHSASGVVSDSDNDSNDVVRFVDPQGEGGVGWNMEEQMKRLNLWAANMEAKRWIAHLYEIRWVPVSAGTLNDDSTTRVE